MSEPTSKVTMAELCTRVAREASLAYNGPSGTSRSMIPVNQDDLGHVKDVVNDGIEMFVNDAPSTGWQWRKRLAEIPISHVNVTGTADSGDATTLVDATLSATYDADDDLNGWYCYISSGTGAGSFAVITDYTTLTGTITVADWLDEYGNAGGTDPDADSGYTLTPYETVAGDPGRYPLPEDFGGEVTGKITYGRGTSHTQRIEWVSESEIRELLQNETSTGYPRKAAIRPLEPRTGLGPKRRYELLVYPYPAQADTLVFPYAVVFNRLDIESGVVTSVTAGSYLFADSERAETDDYFNGWTVTIIDGPGKGESATVVDYTASTGTFTFTAGTWFTVDPTTASVYTVEPANNTHPAGVAFDFAIKSACFAMAELTFENITSGRSDKYHQKDLKLAYEKDARMNAHLIRSRATRYPSLRRWNPVTYNDELNSGD